MLLTNVQLAFSQTCCSAGAPVNSSFEIADTDYPLLTIQTDYNYKSINRLVADQTILLNHPRTRNGHNALVSIHYGSASPFSFGLVLPYIIQQRTSFSEEQSSFGFGDILLLTQYHIPTHWGDWSLGVSSAIKLPTGETDNRDDRSVVLSPDMQSGTGTIDIIGRFSISKKHFVRPNLNVQWSSLYRKNTTNQNFGALKGSTGRAFKFGDEFESALQVSFEMLAKSWFVSPDYSLIFRMTKPNEEQGILASNSGGQWLSHALGLFVKGNNDIGLRAYIELPIMQQLDGLQITTNLEFGLQINYQINLTKNNKNEKLPKNILP